MSKLKGEIYDVIIIGAGISGLVCGCYLAKAGMKVLVIEQHNKPGGYCTSFKRQGFTFDAAAHSFGSYGQGRNFRKIITELGIDKIVKITRFNPSNIVVMPDFKITFWNDIEDTITALEKIFPGERENIKNYYNYYNNLTSTNQFESIKLRDKTFDSFLRSFFTDKTLINAISFPVSGYVGLPPSMIQAATGIKIFNECVIDGGYYVEGGMQALSDAFAQVISQYNGALLCGTPAKRILCTNNIATGIELNNNESYTSKYVVAACDITQTFKAFLGKSIVDKRILDKLDNLIPSISSFILYIGIDKPFEELPEPGTSIWHLHDGDPNSIFDFITHADYPFSDSYIFRVSPDRKTIIAIWFSPFKTSEFWKENKKKIANELLSRIKNHIPNLSNHISYFDAATPYTLYRYTLNHKGANYGWAPLQSQSFDPDFRQKSFIRGLYLTGHWTTQAYGIPSVAGLGYNVAKLIIKREQGKTC